MHRNKILLVEDELVHLEMLTEVLTDNGYRVVPAKDGQQAADALANEIFPVALIDIRLPDISGMSLLELILGQQPDCTIMMMTAQATVEAAVDALKQGAHDYLAKPFRTELLLLKLKRLFHLQQLEAENRSLRQKDQTSGMIGDSASLRKFLGAAQSAAGTDATILLQGESGTGKELAADFIHRSSPRCDGPLVKVNCGAIPETLLESELFGTEKGAYTGAEQARRGYLEQAQGGSLFLDEVGEIPQTMQVKLLRVLQDGVIRRLGSEKQIKVDFRLIAATHRDLAELRDEGTIREDFFYRLNVIPLYLPPLRQRREDIPLLVNHFIGKYAARYAKDPIRLSIETYEQLQNCPLPGNVRELENLIERLQVLAPGKEITPGMLPEPLRRCGDGSSEIIQCFRTDQPLRDAMHDFEQRFIARVVNEENGNRTAAAQRLGISRKSLWEKLSL
ncbi:MAG: sigma-54 dependent transcriptional regulator [Desulfuromonadales bacterium]|nr:sigma-54 dependent transcriptional regulator [Desulfuromonadales bacterium]